MVARQYKNSDLDAMVAIWNEVVEAGDAFPQEKPLTPYDQRSAQQPFPAVGFRVGRLGGVAVPLALQRHE